jgi:hypothetical protein
VELVSPLELLTPPCSSLPKPLPSASLLCFFSAGPADGKTFVYQDQQLRNLSQEFARQQLENLVNEVVRKFDFSFDIGEITAAVGLSSNDVRLPMLVRLLRRCACWRGCAR